jgi:ABC-type multidrug transport system fused ATPase/permease subunit
MFQQADELCVMRDGMIIERGSHYALNEIEDGIYKRLTELQNVN